VTAIGADEIAPGLVVFLDPDVLKAADSVSHTKDPPTARPGPFVCISADDEVSEWLPITTEARWERRAIRREWCSGGHAQWLRDDQYLNDGANIWRGPPQAFVDASDRELTDRPNRARIDATGLAEIMDEVAAQRHRRDRP
jgi:hypothetical protein